MHWGKGQTFQQIVLDPVDIYVREKKWIWRKGNACPQLVGM
jgi:hypothetical protein